MLNHTDASNRPQYLGRVNGPEFETVPDAGKCLARQIQHSLLNPACLWSLLAMTAAWFVYIMQLVYVYHKIELLDGIEINRMVWASIVNDLNGLNEVRVRQMGVGGVDVVIEMKADVELMKEIDKIRGNLAVGNMYVRVIKMILQQNFDMELGAPSFRAHHRSYVGMVRREDDVGEQG